MKKGSGLKLLAVLVLIAAGIYFSISPLTGSSDATKGISLGLDLQGGAQVVLQAVPEEGETITNDDMNQLTEVIRKRVDEFGVSEPLIQREGTDRLLVELAGVDDPDTAISLLGQTAKLEFRGPDDSLVLSGSDLADARAQIDQSAPSAAQRNVVVLDFTSAGAKAFETATATFYNQQISIVLDDVVISSPVVNAVISDGTAVISGGFDTFEEASNLAALLRGGALPVKIEMLSTRTVGPTLGQDSLDKSLIAAAIGLLILAAFMLVYYRASGLWACVSLALYTLILLWALYLFNATLTLTSIAGFILSIGVAVDANIIIFERIKEELYAGKSLRAGIESGFKRAFATILDSNLTTLIAAIVLYMFGTGSIKGFALTLSLGIVASMFTAITFTRFMLRWSSEVDFLAKKPLYGMNRKHFTPKIDFVGKNKLWYAIAAVVIVPGLVVLAISGMNQGIDFTGGQIIQVQYADAVDLAEVRETVGGFVEQTPSIQELENNQFQIRTEDMSEEQSNELIASLGQLGEMSVERSERIGPVIGAELLRNAQLAILIAVILMLAYITIRFQFNFAITAILALVHDALVIVSVFAIFRIEVDSAFIAAILTTLGYSINNTIVIFDRIRENVRSNQRFSAAELINMSINQTLTRSVNTVLAVLFLLFSLLFFGGATTKVFILALTIGMFAGFYSSVFLVGSMLENISRKTGGLAIGKKRAATRVKTSSES